LEKKYQGIHGLAQNLFSSPKVTIQPKPNFLMYRQGSEVMIEISRQEFTSKQTPIEIRVFRYGSNKQKERRVKTFWTLVMENFEDRILQILIVAAIVSLICGVVEHGWGGLIEGVSILVSICIIVSVTATNNWVKER